ncbi:hypothetical protein Enr10x_54210 [Gimesia panareensis]|uniref:Thioredoxin domain-containing protein n=1 Tax=Gimesia panareensis TaxID=2527978 RepID=A0A517QEK4_9PLAN|nr:hypothetical protein [Gimesia panareensis]QDT30061.1 hypothetical protein Enr10x_54210 [Gimesia panareensis]
MPGGGQFFYHKNMGVCALACLSAIAALFLLVPPPQQTEIAWQEYSIPDIHHDMEAGKVILISTYASWDLPFVIHEHWYSHDPAMLNFIKTHPVACYRIDLAKIPEAQYSAWKGYFHSYSPPLGVVLLVETHEHDAVMETIEVDTDQLAPENLIVRLKKLLSLRNPKSERESVPNPAVSEKPSASLKHQSA